MFACILARDELRRHIKPLMATIDFFPVTNFNNQNHNFFILNLAKHPVIPNAIPPKSSEFVPLHGFTQNPWVWQNSKSFIKKADNSFLDAGFKFGKSFINVI